MTDSHPLSPNCRPEMIDFQRLEEICMADCDAILELTDFFFTQAEQEMTALAAAVQSNSAEEVRRLAHRLVGASAGCGMLGLLSPLRELETKAKAGDLSNSVELFDQLVPLLAQCREEISRWSLRSKDGL